MRESHKFPEGVKTPVSKPFIPEKTVHSEGKGKLLSREKYPSEGLRDEREKSPNFPLEGKFAPKDVYGMHPRVQRSHFEMGRRRGCPESTSGVHLEAHTQPELVTYTKSTLEGGGSPTETGSQVW